MEVNIEEIVRMKLAADILDKVTNEDRDRILEAALAEQLLTVFNSYQIEAAIKDDAKKYMAEYIRRSESQEKIRAGVHRAFDNIIEGMIQVFEKQIEHSIKNEYQHFKKYDEE